MRQLQRRILLCNRDWVISHFIFSIMYWSFFQSRCIFIFKIKDKITEEKRKKRRKKPLTKKFVSEIDRHISAFSAKTIVEVSGT